jgi:hypothetical protein
MYTTRDTPEAYLTKIPQEKPYGSESRTNKTKNGKNSAISLNQFLIQNDLL